MTGMMRAALKPAGTRRTLHIGLAILFAGCGAAPQEYAKMAAERDSLVKVVASLQAALGEIRSGPSERLARINAGVARSDWHYVVAAADSLAERHPAAAETKEAKTHARTAQAALDKAEADRKAEEERRAREAAKTAADRVHDVIRVRSFWVSDPNSAGGVDLHIVWQNRSEKTVKYASFTVQAFNAVGDPVECAIRDYSEFTGRSTGPIRPAGWSGEDRVWSNAWYNHSITKGVLRRIELEYTDGTMATISREDVKYARW